MLHNIFSTVTHFFAAYGYWVVFFGVMLENAGIPVPGETVLLVAGFLAFRGQLELFPAILVGIAGATCGDSAGYWIGHVGGRRFVNRFIRKFAPAAAAFDHSEDLFLKYGQWAVFIGRFIAGLREFAGILAGLFRMPYSRFLLFNASGATAWAIAITTLGYVFGGQVKNLVKFLGRFDEYTLIAVGVSILVFVVIRLVKKWKRSANHQIPQ